MCLLSVQQKIPFTFEEFSTIARIHPDGFGFGYYDENVKSLMVNHSMTPSKGFWESYMDAIATGAQVVSHFRMGTHGDKTHANCHPFTFYDVTGQPMLLFHNGIIDFHHLQSWCKATKADSDTAILAKALNYRLENVDSPLLPILLDLVGSSSRFVVMDNFGGMKCFGDGWQEADNGYHSNGSYKGWAGRTTVTYGRGNAATGVTTYPSHGATGDDDLWEGVGSNGSGYSPYGYEDGVVADNTSAQQEAREALGLTDVEDAANLITGPCCICQEPNGRQGTWYGHECVLCRSCREGLADEPQFLPSWLEELEKEAAEKARISEGEEGSQTAVKSRSITVIGGK